METRGLFVGRFQPYHHGHHAMIDRIADAVDELIIAIGSADKSHSLDDPFTGGERVLMVNRVLADLETLHFVVPIQDIDRHAVWVNHIQSLCPAFDIAYSNNPLVIRLFEEYGIEARSTPLFNREDLEGTSIRHQMVEGVAWREYVPAAVETVIDEFDGVERLRQISETDTNGE